MSKRFVAVFLAVVFTFVSIAVCAEADSAKGYERVQEYGIIYVDDADGVNPDDFVTRAEMAQYVVNICGLDGIPFSGGCEDFTDVPKDNASYDAIMNARELGIVNGNGENAYLPDKNVTYAEVLKMLVCALGYEPLAEQRGGWFNGYAIVSNMYGLTEGMNLVMQDEVTLENAAKLLERALDVPLMVQVGFGATTEYAVMNGENGYELRTLADEFK